MRAGRVTTPVWFDWPFLILFVIALVIAGKEKFFNSKLSTEERQQVRDTQTMRLTIPPGNFVEVLDATVGTEVGLYKIIQTDVDGVHIIGPNHIHPSMRHSFTIIPLPTYKESERNQKIVFVRPDDPTWAETSARWIE